ncbi:MAG: alpha/beta fold hydrolase [Saprospiraceae bacterium]|nr:alpha/beta fold hydrolase [Saprospiraceae bacterium]
MFLTIKLSEKATPVVILHALFGTLDNWQTIARQLAEPNTVFIIDQRNHGRSPHADVHDYPTLAEDLRHFMKPIGCTMERTSSATRWAQDGHAVRPYPSRYGEETGGR